MGRPAFATDVATPAVDAWPRERDVLGRYVVLEPIGRGAMGIVLRAYDPKLRREVALKLLRRGDTFDGAEAEARMVREAQALARLNHANVVAVYDTDVTQHGLCIVMEFVEGQSLRAWLAEASRTWTEVLSIGVAIGRGLAAAHASGVVHRDVKPDNVLVGNDGRVRLTDFGLAREPGTPGASNPSGPEGSDPPEQLDDITRAGTVLGTPAYAAPEQHRGGSADAPSDQYALCVLLWEALYGRRPFAGQGWDALLREKLKGPPPRPSSLAPAWLHHIVARGLAVEPNDRWPSVDALVNALASGRARTRTRTLAIGVGTAAAIAIGATALDRWARSARIEGCTRDGDEIAQTWNDDVRAGLKTALVADGGSSAEDAAERTLPWLDAYARDWAGARTEACTRSEVEQTWNDDLLARAVSCLDDRRLEMEALVRTLGSGRPGAVYDALPAVAALGRIEPCLDAALLERQPPPPTGDADAVLAARAELSRATALERTGEYDEGLTVARAALRAAEELEWPLLRARARYQVALLLEKSSAFDEAEKEAEAAYFDARSSGAEEVAAAAATELLFIVGRQRHEHDNGLRWGRHAELAVADLPDPLRLREASLSGNLAHVHFGMGSYAEAEELYERTLAILEPAFGSDHPQVANVITGLAQARWRAGDGVDAVKLTRRACASLERTYGSDHPMTSTCLNNLATMHAERGEHREALHLHEQVLAARERALGPAHLDVAASLHNIAMSRILEGKLEVGAELLERALAIQEPLVGPDHPDVAHTLGTLANARHFQGEFEQAAQLLERAVVATERSFGPQSADLAMHLHTLGLVRHSMGAEEEAVRHYERSRDIVEATLGEDRIELGHILSNLGRVRLSLGALDEAERLQQRALVIFEKGLGPEHPLVAFPLVGLAEIALERQQPAVARPLAERALSIRKAAVGPPSELADAQFVLARALVGVNPGATHAVALAEEAREGYRSAGAGAQVQLAEVEAFLAAQ